jgi:hypothetical protein
VKRAFWGLEDLSPRPPKLLSPCARAVRGGRFGVRARDVMRAMTNLSAGGRRPRGSEDAGSVCLSGPILDCRARLGKPSFGHARGSGIGLDGASGVAGCQIVGLPSGGCGMLLSLCRTVVIALGNAGLGIPFGPVCRFVLGPGCWADVRRVGVCRRRDEGKSQDGNQGSGAHER